MTNRLAVCFLETARITSRNKGSACSNHVIDGKWKRCASRRSSDDWPFICFALNGGPCSDRDATGALEAAVERLSEFRSSPRTAPFTRQVGKFMAPRQQSPGRLPLFPSAMRRNSTKFPKIRLRAHQRGYSPMTGARRVYRDASHIVHVCAAP